MEFGVWRHVFGLIGSVGLMFLGSCQEKDEMPPSAQIDLPTQGNIYSVYDTVLTTFQFSDENEVVSATVELVNSDFVPVTAKEDVLNRTSAELVIDNKLLETGDYYVLLAVKDEYNINREYRRIKIVALPKERRRIFVAVNTSNSSAELWEVDSLFQETSVWLQSQQDVTELAVNSSYDQVAIAGKMSTWLRSFSTNSGSVVWSDQVFTVPQTRRFQDLFWYQNSLFATIYDREIRSYNLSGNLTMNLATGEFRPGVVYADDRFILTEVNLVGDQNHFLNVYSASTRALLWQTTFQFDIVSICPLEDDVVLVFGNDLNDQARMVEYNISENTFWEPRTFPNGEILEAIATESNRFVISHSNGLYAYTYTPNFLNQISAQVHANIKYDVDNGTLIASNGNMLREMTLNGTEINAVSVSGNIVSFDLYYTR